MPIIEPDLSEAGNIPAGTYPARIVAAEPQKSKSKGTPMIELSLKVDVGGTEKTRKTWVVTAGQGAFNFDQLLRACGYDDIADQMKVPGARVPFDTDTLIGQQVNVVIDEEMYNNEPRDRVKSFLRF